jgi:hypothetical protein
MNENRDLIRYLYKKGALQKVENIFFATDAFTVRKISLELVQEYNGKYESLSDFLEAVDPIQEIWNVRQNYITQPIDKSQNPSYTNIPVVVQAPTSVPVPPPMPAYKHRADSDMLDRWMTKD